MSITISKKARVILGTAVAIPALLLCTASSCDNNSQPTGQQSENAQQQADTSSLEQSQPIPHFNWSQIRQTLIDAETISANSTQTTSFFFQQGAPDPVYSCPSIGMPVANTAQLSNPDQVLPDPNQSYGSVVTAQEDPNGIYAPAASEGTYVICVNSSGQDYLDYWEGNVLTVTGAAEWNAATHQLKVTGAPTAAIHTAPPAKP